MQAVKLARLICHRSRSNEVRLGPTTIDPGHAGPHTIRLVYSGGLEDRLARADRLASIALLGRWTILAWRRERRNSIAHGPAEDRV